MSDTNAQEPTMEEILASIRRIISEDETPAESKEADAPKEEPQAEMAPPAPEPAPEPPPSPRAEPPRAAAPPPKADVLELTERVDAPKPKAPLPPSGDLDFTDAPAPPAALPAASQAPKPPPPRAPEPGLVGDQAATAAASHFGSLAQSLAMPASGRSLEDVIKEMLQPMLKDWLDANLPRIVEATVAAEVERISRRGY